MKNLTKQISKSEVEVSYLHASPSGHGHYKVYGEAYMTGANYLPISFTTSNMPLIDAFRSEADEFPQHFFESLEQVEQIMLSELFYKNEKKIEEWVLEVENKEKN